MVNQNFSFLLFFIFFSFPLFPFSFSLFYDFISFRAMSLLDQVTNPTSLPPNLLLFGPKDFRPGHFSTSFITVISPLFF